MAWDQLRLRGGWIRLGCRWWTGRLKDVGYGVLADLESVLDGPPAEEFDIDGSGSMRLVSLDEEEHQLVYLSYMVPRIYNL